MTEKKKMKSFKQTVKDQSGKGRTDPGRDPYDQWSAKAGISEDTAIDTFLKFHGEDPRYVSHEKRAAHGRSLAFKKWKRDIKLGSVSLTPEKPSESVEHDNANMLDELSHSTVDTYVKKSKDDIKTKTKGDSLDHVTKVLKRLRGLKAAGKRVTMESNGQEAVYGGDSGKTGESMNTDGKAEEPPVHLKKKINWSFKGKRYYGPAGASKAYEFSDTRKRSNEEAPRGKDFQIHKEKVDAAIKNVKGNIAMAVNPKKKKEESVLIDDPKGTITRVAEDNKSRKQAQIKSARMIKALYKKHRVTEEIYDWEKDDQTSSGNTVAK